MLPENSASVEGTDCQNQIMYENPAITNEANNNRLDEDERIMTGGTPIQQFYAGQSIFVTGGTGFLGKVLIEKLLRSCPQIRVIYVLVRPKKGVNARNRIDELFQNQVFDKLKEDDSTFREKVLPINGDCSLEGLGLSDADRELLINNVSIVFHAAATIRFDEKLKLAAATNIRSSVDILEMCKKMPKLKSFIHVSTAYANCHVKRIEERFYDHPLKYEDLNTLVNNLSETTIDEITPKLIGDWPNSYTFTKAITESYMRDRSKGLPMGIFRPAIVTSTANEPVPGWIDNFYGPIGIVAGTASGLMRVTYCDKDMIANLIPVDLTVNALIASAWDVHAQKNKRDEDMMIYNFVSCADSPLKWNDFRKINIRYAEQYPISSSVWYLSLMLIKQRTMYLMAITFLHLLPALMVDTTRICMGQKPRMLKIYEKIHKMNNLVSHFCTNEWDFTNDNVHALWQRLTPKDQQLFRFDMTNFDWAEYFRQYMKGIRTYLFKEDPNTLEESRKRFKRLYWAHLTMKTCISVFGVWVLWSIYGKLFH